MYNNCTFRLNELLHMIFQNHPPKQLLQLMSLLLVLSSGCSARMVIPTVAPITLSTTDPIPTRTPMPTSTFLPTQTKIFSPGGYVTATIKPTLSSNLNQATIHTVGFLENWRAFFTLESPSEITGAFYAVLQRNKRYDCFTMIRYPNRLYCVGPVVGLDDFVSFTIYDQANDLPVFLGSVYIPMFQRGSSAP